MARSLLDEIIRDFFLNDPLARQKVESGAMNKILRSWEKFKHNNNVKIKIIKENMRVRIG